MRLYMLGIRKGPSVDMVEGFVITGEDDSQAALDKEEERLRKAAMNLQHVWFNTEKANGKDHETTLDAKWAYGEALREWARFTGNQDAQNHAYKLLNGFV